MDNQFGLIVPWESPTAKRKRRSFGAEFKAEAVRLCQVGDRSISQVAQDLDLTDSALREWVKAAEVKAGSPYASEDYRDELRQRGIIASMSRVGDCWDNAVAESFFATLKAELIDATRYPSRDAAVAAIGDYLEKFYNHARRHSYLGYLSPVEFELRAQVAALAA